MAQAVAMAVITAKGLTGATAFAIAASAAVVDLAITSAYQRKKTADAQKDAASAPRDVTIRSAVEPARIIYGKARTSGPVVYTNTQPTPGTSDNSTLWTAISLANHECESIEEVWLDGDQILWSGLSGTGGVQSGKYGPIGSNEVTNFYAKLGTDSQTALSELVNAFSDWTSSYTGNNVTYLVSAFELGTATGEGVWAQGAPQNIRAVVKGKKVYDPRKDTTNGGSGSHRLADPSTWEWSDNPALCLADYLFDDRLGLGAEGVTYNEIDWEMVADAADICDSVVSVPGGSEKRFTCNGVLSTGTTYADNVRALASAMNGMVTWSGGKYRIRSCAYEAPTYTFTEDDIVGDVQVQPELTRSRRFNAIRGTYIDPESDYNSVEFIPVTNTTYQNVRDNGQQLYTNISLPMTNSEYMAQRIGYKSLNLNNQQLTAVVPLNWKALKVGVGDRIQLNVSELGWSNKIFVVENWSFEPDKGFVLSVKEDSSSAYNDPAAEDYSTRTAGGQVVFADQPVSAPSGIQATSEEEAILVEWDAPPRGSGYDEVVVYASADSSWANASEVARTRSTSFRHELSRGTTRYYWVRSVDVDGQFSIRDPDSDTSSVTATAGQIGTSQLNDDANFALTADWESVTDSAGTKPEDNATYNTGALADLDTVDTDQIANNAVTITKIADTLQSTNYSAGTAGWKLTTGGIFEAGDGTFRGDITASSFTIEAGATVSGIEAQAVAGLPQASFTSIGASTYSPAVNGSRVTWTENGTEENWNTKLVSDQSFSGGAFITFVVNKDNANNSRYMVGLANTATGNSFSVIDYAVYVNGSTGNIQVYESGSAGPQIKSSITAGDIITVFYDGNKVQYIVNGTVEREASLASPLTGQVYAHIAIDNGSTHDVEHRIDGLQFGPVTSVVENLNDGVSLTSGGLTLSSGGAIKGGQTAYDNGTGFFLGYENSAYKLSIGDSANDKLTFDGSNLAVTGNITAQQLTLAAAVSIGAGNIAYDDVTLTNSGGNLVIKAGGVGTTQLDDDAVTNAKISSGSVSLSNIIEGSVSKVNPVTQTGNIYRWAGYDDAGNVVNAVPSGIAVEYDTTEKALELRNDGNVGMRSDTFKIDHNSIYKITFQVKKDAAVGNWYVGAYQLTSATTGFVSDGGNVQSSANFTVYDATTRASGSGANAYFWSQNATTSYQEFTAYLLGSNVDINEVPAQTTTIIQAADGYDHVGLRILNWNNAGTTTSLFIKHLSVVEMTATTIVAENISTTNLAAISSDLGAITAGSLNINDAFTVSSAGVMTATGADVSGAITATSLTLSGTSIAESQLAQDVQDSLALADSASQVNRGLALLLNQTTGGTTNSGEAALVGVDKNGSPATDTDGFIVWNGDKITVERGQYTNSYTIVTNVANKTGFIAFDVNKTQPFSDVAASGNDTDVAFVWKIGSQWYYDANNNGNTFTPSSVTGNRTGTDGTTTPRLVALGYMQTGSVDTIIKGGLFGEPIDLELASFPTDVIQSGSVGGVTITDSKLYQGTGTFNNSNTGFYLDSTGQFSLKDKLAFFPSNNTLRVKGNIEADVITVNQNLQVVGDLKASSLAIASITREMFTQDALDEIYGALATAVGGSNGDYKEASGSFTTSGGTVTLALFDHGESNVVVEWLENYGFAQTTDYTGTALQATLTFEASTTSNFATIAASKTETITLGKYDLSAYYGSTYIWYYGPRSVTKTFTTTDLADTTDYYFRVRVTSVGSAFTGITYPFELEANEGVTGVVSTGGNADTLDNLDSTAFLRSNVDDTFDGNLTVTGNLTVQGATTSLEVATLQVEDKNIVLNYGAGDTSGSANGAGITIQDAVNASTDASLTWNASGDYWNFSHQLQTSTLINSNYISSQYFVSYGGQELILAAGESQAQLVGVTGGNPLQDEYVYAVAESGLQVISSPSNWISGTNSYNDATWAQRNVVTIGKSDGQSDFPAQINVTGHGNSSQWNTAYGWGNHASAGYLAASSYTAADVLAKIKTVDGASSGLDADTVDGLQATSFLRSDANDTHTNTLTFSRAGSTAFMSFPSGATLSTVNASGGELVLRNLGQLRLTDGNDWDWNAWAGIKYDTGGSTLYIGGPAGAAFTANASPSNIDVNFVGLNSSGLKKDGNVVFHAGNDGSGSGLDADLLDGQQGSYYQPASSAITTSSSQDNHLYIRNTSPTIYLRDTDHLPSMLHQNSSRFYVLRGATNDATSWTAHASGAANNAAGRWPLEINITDDGNYVRFASSAVTAGGYTVWHSGNDGSGSTLDADTVDGLHASNFARGDATWTSAAGWKQIFHSGSGGASFPASHYSMGVDYANGAWSHPNYSDLIIGYHTGIRLGGGYSGIRFYNNSPTTDANNDGNGDGGEALLMTIGGGGTATSGAHVYIENSLYIKNGGSTNNVAWNAGNDGSGSGLDADLLDGLHATTGATANTIAARDAGGDLYQRYGFAVHFNQSGGNSENPTIGQIWTQNTSDNYVRKSTPAHFISNLGLWTSGNDGSGSGLDADMLDGRHLSAVWPAHSGSDFVNGTLVTTNIPANTQNGASFVIEVTGKSYSANPPFSFIAQGYLYNNTIIAYSGINLSGYGPSEIKMFEDSNGYLAFWWGRISYWNSFSVHVRNANGTSDNCVTNITNSAEPSSSKKVTVTLTKTWTNANHGSGSGLDADLLDGVHGSSFLRSDASDNYTGGTLSFNSGTALKMLNGSNFDASSGDVYANFRVIRNAGTANLDGLYIGYQNSNSGLTRIFGGGQGSGGIYISGSGANDIKFNNSSVFWHAGNDGSGSGLDADTVDGLDSASFVRADASDTMAGHLIVQHNGVTTTPGYTQGQVELYTSSNYVPALGFHRAGYSATTLYENDGQLYVNPWVTRAQAGLLLSTGNIGTYAWTSSNDGSGSGLDADLLDGQHASAFLGVNATAVEASSLDIVDTRNDGARAPNDYADHKVTAEFTDDINGAWYSALTVKGWHDGYAPWQLVAYSSTGQSEEFYVRFGHGSNNTWTGLRTIWHSGNDGSGSGLDADLLDGVHGSSFLRSDAVDTMSGNLTVQAYIMGDGDGYRHNGVYGNYNSYRIHHMWGMGTSYKINPNGTDFGNLYGFAYTYSNRVYTSNAMAGGHQVVWCQAGSPTSAIGNGIWTSGNVTAYSDRAVKTNLELIPDALAKVCQINGYTYDRTDFKPDPETGEMPNTRQAGVVAQEVEKVLPEVVSGDEGGKAVAYGNMVSLLIEAIKELKAEVDDLKSKLEEVK